MSWDKYLDGLKNKNQMTYDSQHVTRGKKNVTVVQVNRGTVVNLDVQYPC